MGNCATKFNGTKDEASLKPLAAKEEAAAVEEVKHVAVEGDDAKDKKEQNPVENFRRSVSHIVKEIVDNVGNCASKPKVLESGEPAPLKIESEDEKKVADDGHDAKEKGVQIEDEQAGKPETVTRSLSNLFETEVTNSTKPKEASEAAKTVEIEKTVTVDEKTAPSETTKKPETQDAHATKPTEEKKTENTVDSKEEKPSVVEKKIEVVEAKTTDEKKPEAETQTSKVTEDKKPEAEKKEEVVKAETVKVPEEKKVEPEQSKTTKPSEDKVTQVKEDEQPKTK